MAVLLLLAQQLAPLVWDAVDAPQAEYAQALLAVRRHPDGASWKKVAEVLRKGRTHTIRDRPAITDPVQLKKVLDGFGWRKGEVRAYPLGGDAPAFYHLIAPPRAGSARVPVYLDLGIGLGQLQRPPAGWAYVQPNWPMIAVMEQAGIPVSMVAGREFQSLVLSILVDLERRIPVDHGRLYIGGYSRGGNSAWYLGIHWPDRFAGIIAASGYYPIDEKFLHNLDHVRVLAAVGKDQRHKDSNAFTKRTAESLRRKRHTKTQILVSDGRAIDESFVKRAWAWMDEGEASVALPSRVRYSMDDAAHRGAYWITIREVKKTGGRRPLRILEPGGTAKETVHLNRKPASVDARITARNRIVLATSNVRELVIHLASESFDFDRDIEVRIGAATRVLRAKPAVNRLIANYRRHRDPRRLYPADLVIRP